MGASQICNNMFFFVSFDFIKKKSIENNMILKNKHEK